MDGGQGEGLNRKDGREQREKDGTEKDGSSRGRMMEQRKTNKVLDERRSTERRKEQKEKEGTEKSIWRKGRRME